MKDFILKLNTMDAKLSARIIVIPIIKMSNRIILVVMTYKLCCRIKVFSDTFIVVHDTIANENRE